VVTIKDALNRVVTYEYNGNGDVTKVINEAGTNTTANYDLLGRTSWVKDGAFNQTSISYNAWAGL